MTGFALFLLFAPSGDGGRGGMGIFLFQMLAFVAIIYFLMIRPKIRQEKRHRERLGQIKRGDEIVTTGGIMGKVVHIDDDKLTIKSGESRLIVQRGRVGEVHTPGTEAETKRS